MNGPWFSPWFVSLILLSLLNSEFLIFRRYCASSLCVRSVLHSEFKQMCPAMEGTLERHEPPKCMDTSLPDWLERPSLSYAVMSMRNTSKCACVLQEVFLTCDSSLNKRFFLQILWHERFLKDLIFNNYHK